MKLRDDLTTWQHVPFEATRWTPSPDGSVERKMLERDGEEVARATSIVRYPRGSAFPSHVHERGEEFVVLEGTFSDEHGSYPEGTYVRNPPGSKHRPFSAEGCTIFVKLRQSAPDDLCRLVAEPAPEPEHSGSASQEATRVSLLHRFREERVSFLRLAPGAALELDGRDGGAELFVLSGEMRVDDARCERWTWLRAPRARVRIHTENGCVFWLKQGHLP